MQKPLVIANWEDGFEIAQSRRRAGRLSWVAMPTRHDSRGYRRLIRSDGGVRAFACWVVMVQVAARSSIRGVLADDRGIPLSCLDLEAMTDIPASYFEQSIPLLCDIGWLLCPESYASQTKVGEPTEHGMSTVQTDSTKQNTTVNSSSLFLTHSDAQSCWNLLPKGKKRGNSKWRRAWAEIIEPEQIDHQVLMNAIHEYYQSGEGQSDYFRNPATLIQDRIWEEEPESWNTKHRKPNDPKEEEGAFAEIFGENENE